MVTAAIEARNCRRPEERSTGLTPHEPANDASLPSRSGLSPTAISRATAVTNAMQQPCASPRSDLLICAAIHRLQRMMHVKPYPTQQPSTDSQLDCQWCVVSLKA